MGLDAQGRPAQGGGTLSLTLTLTLTLTPTPTPTLTLTPNPSPKQDFVPNDLEMRLYLVRGEIAHVVYTDFDVDNWYAAQRDGGFTKGPESF